MKYQIRGTKFMPETTSPFAERILWTLLGIIGSLTVLHLVLQFFYIVVLDAHNPYLLELSNRFDLDDESSVPTWLSAVLLASTAALAFVAARMQTNILTRRLWLLIGAIALVFSIDEIATIHEFILQLSHIVFFGYSPSTFLQNAWWTVAPIVVVGAGLLLMQVVKHFPHRTSYFLGVGSIIYIIGALFIEVLAIRVSAEGFLGQGILVAAEECLELLGIAVIIYAIVDYLDMKHGSQFKAAAQLLDTKVNKNHHNNDKS